jgi:hypothetical protein
MKNDDSFFIMLMNNPGWQIKRAHLKDGNIGNLVASTYCSDAAGGLEA